MNVDGLWLWALAAQLTTLELDDTYRTLRAEGMTAKLSGFLLTLDFWNETKMKTPANVRAEIRKLYHETTPATVERDLRRAIALLKSLDTEAERARVAVFMDGLSQMRSEWILARRQAGKKRTATTSAARKTRGS